MCLGLWIVNAKQITGQVFQSTVDGDCCDRMTRSQFSRQKTCPEDIHAGRCAREDTFFSSEAPGHLSCFGFIDVTCFIIKRFLQQRGDETYAYSLDVMCSTNTLGNNRRGCWFERYDTRGWIETTQDLSDSHQHVGSTDRRAKGMDGSP